MQDAWIWDHRYRSTIEQTSRIDNRVEVLHEIGGCGSGRMTSRIVGSIATGVGTARPIYPLTFAATSVNASVSDTSITTRGSTAKNPTLTWRERIDRSLGQPRGIRSVNT